MCAATARTCACVSVCVWDGGDSRWDRMFQMIVFNHPHQSYERIKLYLCVSCLCACVCVLSWIIKSEQSAVSTSAPLSYFYTLHVMKSCVQQKLQTHSWVSIFSAAAFQPSVGSQNKPGPCCHKFSALFFFWRCMNGRGDGRTPWWRPSLPGQPACLAI